MSAIASNPILCGGCDRKFAWKPQLAGKRVKCKCGHVITVSGASADPLVAAKASPTPKAAASARPSVPVKTPATAKQPRPAARPAAPDDDFDALAALAADADRAAATIPVEIRDVPTAEQPAPAARKSGKPHPLAYKRGPSAADQRKGAANAAALTDPVRDVYVPSALVAVGLLLYVGYYGYRFELNASALAMVTVGLSIVTVVKTALMVGAALMLAGPLGVGFGELWSAVLKLGAIAVFTDGATAWVDHLLAHAVGGHVGDGLFSYGLIGWPVSIGLYWGLMVYLFSMDVADARLVVVCLGVLSRLLRAVIVMCLLSGILSLGGVNSQTAATAGVGSVPASSIHVSALSAHVDDLKAGDFLVEARKYIADGHQAACGKAVEGWYAAGCPNVWFEMSGRDINGRRSAMGLIVQLPDDSARRAKAYGVLKQYDDDLKMGGDPSAYKDDGESYLQAGLR